ncbi:MAG: hypothetical protein JJ867_03525 [Marinobacter sp.]|nr:hypothetical protein [Marinobacter sp.]
MASVRITSQRGALIFLAPLAIATISLLTVFAIDGARLLSLQSEMQNQANAAASAAADGAQACGGANIAMPTMSSRALAAAQAAGYDGDADALQIVPGVLESTEDDPVLRFRQVPETALSRSNGVHVTLTREESISRLLPGAMFGTVTLEATAAVRKEVSAGISAAGSAAGVEDGLLGGLVGAVLGDPTYSLGLTDLASLENTLVSVGDLLSQLGADDVVDILDEPLIDLLTGVTSAVGGTGQPAGRIVDDLTVAAGINGLRVSDVLEVVEGASVPEDSSFPVYDLVISTVMNSAKVISDSGSLVSLSVDTADSPLLQNLTSSIGALANLDVALGLQVAEPPKMVFGSARQDADGQWLTRFRSADVRLELLASAGLSETGISGLISGLSLGLLQLDLLDAIEIPLVVQAGGGQGELVSAECAAGGSDNDVTLGFDLRDTAVSVETGRLLPGSGAVDPASIEASILDVRLLGVPVTDLCVEAGLAVDVSSAGSGLALIENYPLQCVDGECARQSVTSGGGASGLAADATVAPLDILSCGGSSLSSALLSVAGVLEPVIRLLVEDVASELVEGLVSPLLTALGVAPGNMTVTVLSAHQNNTQLIEDVSIVTE